MAKIAVEKVREFRAEAKFQRTSPQKAKLVLDIIKGMRVEQALNTVAFLHQADGADGREGVALGHPERHLRVAGAGPGRGCRQPLRSHRGSQRRAAHEAHPARADGPRVPLPAPACAHHRDGGGEEDGRGLATVVGGGSGDAGSKEAGKTAAKKAPAKKVAAKKAPAKKAAAKKAAK